MTQIENGDRLDGRSGSTEARGEAWSPMSEVLNIGSTSEKGDTKIQSEVASVLPVDLESTKEGAHFIDEHKSTSTESRKQFDVGMSTSGLVPGGFLGSSAPPVLSITAKKSKDQSEEDRGRLPSEGDSHQGEEPETRLASSTERPPGWIQRQSQSHSPTTTSVFVSSLLTSWAHDGATIAPLPDSLLPGIGSNVMPKEDGAESLWTEAARPGGGK